MNSYKQALEFQELLIKHLTTTELMGNDAYTSFRKELIESTQLKDYTPQFLIQNRSIQQLSQSLKATLPTYAERRIYIRDHFSRLLDFLEFGETFSNESEALIRNAFISYSSEDKITAGKLKNVLESHDIPTFMAHDDIEVSEEWSKRILIEINTCSIFVCLLSKNFMKSEFCLQETGIAANRENVCIIPLSLDGTIPPGFLKKFQSSKLNSDQISIKDFLPAFLRFDLRMAIAILINLLKSVKFYRGAEFLAIQLRPYLGKLKDYEIKKLITVCRENDQIYDAGGCATTFLPLLIQSFSSHMDKETKEFFEAKVIQYS